MVIEINLLDSDSQLHAAAEWLVHRTVMIVGAAGSGKTWLARRLVEHFSERGTPAALVSADMGQPSFGVPTCLALATQPSWDRPRACWFVGDIAPVSNLLPTVVGTARLVELARSEGCPTIVIDTGGLVDGAVARALKYHKALASGADRVIAIERDQELASLAALLDQPQGRVVVCPSPSKARERSFAERKAYRERCYAMHFQDAIRCELDPACLIERDWTTGTYGASAHLLQGTVVGLLDSTGFCLAVGLVNEVRPDRIVVTTPWQDPSAVGRLQIGKIRLDPDSYQEIR